MAHHLFGDTPVAGTAHRTRRPAPLTTTLLAIVSVTATLLVAVTGPGNASAETPAERCARETSTYNAAWATSWAASNPGQSPSNAPPPPVPYVCVEPQDPTTTPTSPTTTAPGLPQADDTGTGPNAGAHAPTDIPPPGSTPIVTVHRASQPATSSGRVPASGTNDQNSGNRGDSPTSETAGPSTPPSQPTDRSTREFVTVLGAHTVGTQQTAQLLKGCGFLGLGCIANGILCAASIAAIVVPILKLARITAILGKIAARKPEWAHRISDIIDKIEDNPNPRSIWNILKGEPDLWSIVQEILGIGGVLTSCGAFLDGVLPGGDGDGSGGSGGNGGNGGGSGGGGETGVGMGSGTGGTGAPQTNTPTPQPTAEPQAPPPTAEPPTTEPPAPPPTAEPAPTTEPPVQPPAPNEGKPRCDPYPACLA